MEPGYLVACSILMSSLFSTAVLLIFIFSSSLYLTVALTIALLIFFIGMAVSLCINIQKNFTIPLMSLSDWLESSFSSGEFPDYGENYIVSKFINQAVGLKNKIDKASEIIRSEGDLVQLRGETEFLQKKLCDIEKCISIQKNYLGIMSHELGQPLYSAKIALTNMSRNSYVASNNHIKNYIDVAIRHLDNAKVRIDHMLSYNKHASKCYVPELEVVDFYQLIEASMLDNSIAAHDKGLFIDLVIKRQFHNSLITCPGGWRQILNNLIGNAIKYTNVGGVTINVHADNFRSQTEFDLEVEVVDTGIGIKREDVERIFDYYVRVGSSESEAGYGIGLGIVHSYVKTLKGVISVDSKPGEGSVFKVSIPVQKAMKPLGSAQSTCISIADSMNLTFLVMGKRRGWLTSMQSRFENLGVRCHATSSIDEAAQHIGQQGSDTLVVCLGDDLVTDHAKALRAAAERVMLVGCNKMSWTMEALQIGLDMIVDDCIEIEDLVKRISIHTTSRLITTPTNPRRILTDLKDRHILLIDDNLSNLEITKEFLAHYGADVHIAHGPEEGLCKAKESRYDAICIDVMMPRINGIELARCIRREGKNKGSPLFAFTASYPNEFLINAMSELNMTMLLKMEARDKMVRSILEKLA